MRTANDPRHIKRQELIQELFKVEFHKQPVKADAQKILQHIAKLDSQIHAAAKEFPIEKINKVDLAILRLAVYELTVMKKEPTNVIIDEAIELAKEFGGSTSPSFINGALANIIKHEEFSKVS
ncbi:MAG TPA: transcription antitermination factor NusB [Patescibacteria group bacterium]|nr:transcription antitermination factor NusB [Patescibacteria group bacterium]